MAPIEPYTISVPEEQRQRLTKKLEVTTFPDELDKADWDYGAPLADIKRLATYWREQFDWGKQETKLNELPNFKTAIQVDGFESLDIHFVYQKSNVNGAIPLLFSHGCASLLITLQFCLLIVLYIGPGSFVEVTKILPLLANGGKEAPAFHVVAPSLPNFGFSSGIKKKGFGLPQYAETCHKLMLRLGYDRYGTSPAQCSKRTLTTPLT